MDLNQLCAVYYGNMQCVNRNSLKQGTHVTNLPVSCTIDSYVENWST